MQLHDLFFEPYIPASQIESAVEGVARRINADYAHCITPPLFLVTLSGAFMFAAELSKYLNIPVEFAFVKCSSYNTAAVSSGEVRFEVECTVSPTGRDVIVVEDVVDTGNTYVALHAYLMRLEARSIRIASLLLKTEVYDKSLPLDYVALSVENIFLVGYGLDYNQLGRNINGIYRQSTR